MSREIKFRAWYKHTKEMLEVLEIKLKTHPHMHLTLDGKSPIHYFGVGDNCVLMQYIGLKDKNGKEGYKDDLVKMFGRSLYQIVWNNDYARFQLELVKGEELIKVYSMDMLQYSEIVGSIYENPELLNEGKHE
jgi:uncharacterized phage protein (TIGR01671 family)